MTSRIWIDVRGDGYQVEHLLKSLGFKVETFYPARACKPELGHSQVEGAHCEHVPETRRLLFQGCDPVFAGNHQTLAEGVTQDECGRVVPPLKKSEGCPHLGPACR